MKVTVTLRNGMVYTLTVDDPCCEADLTADVAPLLDPDAGVIWLEDRLTEGHLFVNTADVAAVQTEKS